MCKLSFRSCKPAVASHCVLSTHLPRGHIVPRVRWVEVLVAANAAGKGSKVDIVSKLHATQQRCSQA